MRKIATILIAVLILFSFSVSAFAADLTFDDVSETHWAYKTVMRAVELGLFEGTRAVDANGVGTFAPDRTMTRAEFITVCIRA